MRFRLRIAVAALLAVCLFAQAQEEKSASAATQPAVTNSGDAAAPKYLQLARELVKNLKPENNQYHTETSNRYIRFPSDFLSSGYTVHTDCTGFVEAMLERGQGITPRFSTQAFRSRYSITDWVDGVERGEMFDKVANIKEVKPGDFFLWKYLPNSQAKTGIYNGHILIIDTVPVRIEPQRKPLAPGMQQWEVWIMDSSPGPSSIDDTRYVAKNAGSSTTNNNATLPENTITSPPKKITGVGRGRMYLYTDEAGIVKGWANAYASARTYWHGDEIHLLMARPRIQTSTP